MTGQRTQPRLAEIDALRGVATVLVVLFHYTIKAPDILPGVATIPVHVSWGAYGVHLFFAISGFVIFMTLERTRTLADFAVARVVRLYPTYWAGIALTTLGVHALGAHSLGQPAQVVLANLTMLHGFVYIPAVDGVYWSLTVELSFYLCMGALWQLRALDRIERVLMAWLALRLAWWLVPALPSLPATLLLVEYIGFFAVGIAAYRVWRGARSWQQQAPLLALAIIMTATFDGLEPALAHIITLAIFIAIVSGRLSFLNNAVLLWFGALSYPIYLLHQNLGYAAIALVERLGGSPWLATTGTLSLVLALAQLVRNWVELPALQAIRTLWKQRRAPRMA